MSGNHTAWWIPGDFDTQEYEYTECRLDQIDENLQKAVCANDSQTPFSLNGVQTSLQMRTDDSLYINIHEAALKDYPCMHLLYDKKTRSFRSFDPRRTRLERPHANPLCDSLENSSGHIFPGRAACKQDDSQSE